MALWGSSWMKFVALTTVVSPSTIQALDDSSAFGTLQRCNDARCLWVGRDGIALSSDDMVTQFLQDEGMDLGSSEFRIRIEEHVDYLEQVHKHAKKRDWVFPYAMGVNTRHLYHDGDRKMSPFDFVQQEHQAAQRQQQRRLTEQRRLAKKTRYLDTARR
ncbi:unnamed protein product [Peronospora destructor]|uniref:Uncharacterized protein n=1 Tax=Peronospora destructor TaxID=86335 RepID=A0AAV0U713_9STRA|nr:unnamed protein product [Peronospora destructor]